MEAECPVAWGQPARAGAVRTRTSPGPGHLFYRKLNQGDPESLKRPQSCDRATARQGLELSPGSGSMLKAKQIGKAICRVENAVAQPAPGRFMKSTPQAFPFLGTRAISVGVRRIHLGSTEPWQDCRSGSTLDPKTAAVGPLPEAACVY